MNELKIGERIAELRGIQSITQLDLAERLGVTDRAVSKWETGGGYPDITLLPDIADIFGVSLDYLLRGKPQIRQRLEIFYPEGNRKSVDRINTEYLSQGWQVANVTLTGCGEGHSCGTVLLQKELYGE